MSLLAISVEIFHTVSVGLAKILHQPLVAVILKSAALSVSHQKSLKVVHHHAILILEDLVAMGVHVGDLTATRLHLILVLTLDMKLSSPLVRTVTQLEDNIQILVV
jgi:hypothetical protein